MSRAYYCPSCGRPASEPCEACERLRSEVADLKARPCRLAVQELEEAVTKHPELKRSGPALKARPTSDLTTEGWWYANKRSIDVLGRSPRGDVTCVRIRLSDILKRLK